MKAIMLTMRLYYFYLTYKGIKNIDVRKTKPSSNYLDCKADSEVKRPIDVYECVSKTNWKQDLMKIPEEEREFFARFVGKVGLKFTLNKVEEITPSTTNNFTKDSCLTIQELENYLWSNILFGYAWHIDKLEVFHEPRELSSFLVKSHKVSGVDREGKEKTFTILKPIVRAPQSWCYVEE